MASLQDILAEIFAPNPALANAGPPVPTERQSMPNAEPLSVPVPNVPNTGPGRPMSAQDDNPLMAWLKQKFSTTPQPPDGMDERTYQPGRPMPKPGDFGVAPPSAPPPSERPWATATPDSNEGYAKQFGFVSGGANDPGQRVQPTVERQPAMQPTASPGPRPSVGPPRASMGPGPVAPQGQGEQGNEMARIFRNLFQGAAAVDPTSPKVSAIMQGAAGSATSRYKELEAENARKQQLARQGFEDTLKVRKDQREEGLAGSLQKYRAAKSNQDQSGMRYQDIAAFNNDVRNMRKAVGEAVKNGEMTPEQGRAEIQKEYNKLVQQRLQKTIDPKVDDKAAPKAVGDGKTKDAPAAPMSKADVDRLPKGSYYVNPADGEIYQKK